MKYLFIYLKGVAMGAADVVPGVSGGTIAFITGILDTLLNSIRSINFSLLGIIKRQGIKAAFMHINGPFLVCVFGGILTSILTLAKIISHLLEAYPIPVWSFFFGLILISVLHMLKQVQGFNWARLALFVSGVIFAWGITMVQPLALEYNHLNVFLAGCIAVTAMLLPGISGSFILVLLGLYGAILGAVKHFDIEVILIFASGAVVGLLSLSHVLSLLLRHFHDATLVFLTGLMLGTLGKIWPWKQTLSWRENSKGEQVALLERNLSPLQFEQLTGQNALLLWAVLAMLAGMLLVWGLERFAARHPDVVE